MCVLIKNRIYKYFFDYDRLTDWPTDRLTDWPTDRLTFRGALQSNSFANSYAEEYVWVREWIAGTRVMAPRGILRVSGQNGVKKRELRQTRKCVACLAANLVCSVWRLSASKMPLGFYRRDWRRESLIISSVVCGVFRHQRCLLASADEIGGERA